MLPIFDGLRDVTLASVTTRMLLAVLCGGLIGIERAYKRRPAGFRTHILICLGAAITTLTSQFLYLNLHYYTDMARLGAQVVAGIGFIGAGTIIVTRQHRVKGLTTAAGLWASAIIGLALGGGFYEGALLTTVLVLVAESFLSRLDTGSWTMCRRSISTWSTPESLAWKKSCVLREIRSPFRIWRSPATPTARATTLRDLLPAFQQGAFPWMSC